MDLETALQSEVSQKEKNKYRILTHIYGIQRYGTDETIQGRNKDTVIENRLVDAAVEGGTNQESSTDVYTLPHVNQILVGGCCVTRGTQLGAL